ncbi:MAG: DNA double-strand break repair nuclease NurA [Acidobacteria bacterium]|nr:DNA double-strand break repair nuclease NurA [Acidobacteriota bacterium]
MLYQSLLTDALREQCDEFVQFEREWRDDVFDYAQRLRALDGLRAEDVSVRLGAMREPGALPSDELERTGSVLLPFGVSWRTHEEARRWAIDALEGRVTFAADGSQLLPGREISLPVAAVQVAWFENPHTRDGKYEKQARFQIIPPGALLEDEAGRVNAETVVALRRFQLEVAELRRFLSSKRDWRERKERPPVAFFDGTLLISIAQPRTKIQERYVDAMVELVRLSRETEVPLVGFVDQSYARDLISLLDALNKSGAHQSRALYDAQLLRALEADGQPLLKAWGDRTAFCYCLRHGLTESFSDDAGRPLVGFTYLQTTGNGAPARLDIPSWVYEAGLLEEVLDAVRAECVGGLGYPYAIETADAAAVITTRDREQFLHALQDFAREGNFSFQVSRKAASKVRRR